MSASTSAAATKEAAEDRNGSSSRSYYRDHHVRPPYSYADLLKQALDPSTGATTKSLTEIYDWIEANYAYYRGPGDGKDAQTWSNSWRSSIRHTLAFNHAFAKHVNVGGGDNWKRFRPAAGKLGRTKPAGDLEDLDVIENITPTGSRIKLKRGAKGQVRQVIPHHAIRWSLATVAAADEAAKKAEAQKAKEEARAKGELVPQPTGSPPLASEQIETRMDDSLIAGFESFFGPVDRSPTLSPREQNALADPLSDWEVDWTALGRGGSGYPALAGKGGGAESVGAWIASRLSDPYAVGYAQQPQPQSQPQPQPRSSASGVGGGGHHARYAQQQLGPRLSDMSSASPRGPMHSHSSMEFSVGGDYSASAGVLPRYSEAAQSTDAQHFASSLRKGPYSSHSLAGTPRDMGAVGDSLCFPAEGQPHTTAAGVRAYHHAHTSTSGPGGVVQHPADDMEAALREELFMATNVAPRSTPYPDALMQRQQDQHMQQHALHHQAALAQTSSALAAAAASQQLQHHHPFAYATADEDIECVSSSSSPKGEAGHPNTSGVQVQQPGSGGGAGSGDGGSGDGAAAHNNYLRAAHLLRNLLACSVALVQVQQQQQTQQHQEQPGSAPELETSSGPVPHSGAFESGRRSASMPAFATSNVSRRGSEARVMDGDWQQQQPQQLSTPTPRQQQQQYRTAAHPGMPYPHVSQANMSPRQPPGAPTAPRLTMHRQLHQPPMAFPLYPESDQAGQPPAFPVNLYPPARQPETTQTGSHPQSRPPPPPSGAVGNELQVLDEEGREVTLPPEIDVEQVASLAQILSNL